MTQPTLPDWTKRAAMPRNAQGRWADEVTDGSHEPSADRNRATEIVSEYLSDDPDIRALRPHLFDNLTQEGREASLQTLVRFTGLKILRDTSPLRINSAIWLGASIANALSEAEAQECPEDLLTRVAAVKLGRAMKIVVFNFEPDDDSVVAKLLSHQVQTYDWHALAEQVLANHTHLLSQLSYSALAEAMLQTVDWSEVATAFDYFD